MLFLNKSRYAKEKMPGHLTSTPVKINIIRGSHTTEAIVIYCPECETNLDVEEDEVDEGEIISCPECGTDFEVVTTNPVELKAVEEGYDEEDDEEETEDGDYS
jgi:alpha-aminoadipate carrier protein LysW